MNGKLKSICVRPDLSLREVMRTINANAQGIVLVVDGEGRLLDTVTDGDLRRAVLAGTDLNLPVSTLQARRSAPPTTAPAGSTRSELVHLMTRTKLRQMPLVDASGKVADLVTLDDLIGQEEALGLSAVVMAGGQGMRLRPLTNDLPKPLLPIGDKPLVERTIEQLREAGIGRVYFATHYKADAFAQHFGNGEDFGVKIGYMEEERPLGTAGALGRLNGTREPLLVINGDIVTSLNYRALLDFHRENRADMTVGVRHFEFNVPYGVVATEGAQVSGIVEKPTQRMFVNAGIYLLEAAVCKLVPPDKHFDMTDLISALLEARKRVVAFPISEYWIDIGHPEDYERARADAAREEAKK